MKKSILLAALVLVIGGQAFAKKLKPITIKNNTGHNIFVSWGCNPTQLQSFSVLIEAHKTLKINDWDVDLPTNVFVNSPLSPVSYSKEHDKWIEEGKILQGINMLGFVGEIYIMPIGEEINLKYSDKTGMHSNSMFGSKGKDKQIFTKCRVGEGSEFVVVPVSECTERFPVVNPLGKSQAGNKFQKYISIKMKGTLNDLDALQKYSNEMRDFVYETK